MTDPSIRPRLIDGEPTCSVACPQNTNDDPYVQHGLASAKCLITHGDAIGVCVPMLRRLLAEAREVSAEAFADWCDVQHPAFQAESLHGEVVAMCDLVDRFHAAIEHAPADEGADGGIEKEKK